MQQLKFHLEDYPQLEALGARYVIVAHCGSWRDGVVTNDAEKISTIKRELRRRFMLRHNMAA